MSRRSRFVLAVLATSGVLVAGSCGSNDDASGGGGESRAAKTTTAEHEHEHEHDDAQEPTNVPEPTPKGDLAPIVVTSPQPLAYVTGSFVLAGSAQVFEGDLRWALLDAKLKPMKQGATTASCGGPCRGKFRVRIPLAGVELGSWELHVWAPPVDDDDPPRVHDTMVPITVTDQPVEGAPPPGAAPPGGVPGG